MKEDIIKMAREIWGDAAILPFDQLERFFHMAQAAEREECVRICREHWLNGGNAMECADAIRNRENT